MEQNKYQHSDKLPLSLVVEELEKDAEFTDKALQILSVEVRGCAHIPMKAVSVLIDRWLETRALNCYIDGKLVDIGDQYMCLVDGNYTAGREALENWMMISKDELAALLKQRNLSVPAFLRPSVKVSKAPPPGGDEEQAAPVVVSTNSNPIPTNNWKLKIQAEAARRWKELVTMGCSPTRNSIKDDLAKWCRDNKVTTDGEIFPNAEYIYRHVIRAKIWKSPTK